MIKILDIGCGRGHGIIVDAFKPSQEKRYYVGLDKDGTYFIDSPEKVCRIVAAQMLGRSAKKSEVWPEFSLEPWDEPLHIAVEYLLQDYEIDDNGGIGADRQIASDLERYSPVGKEILQRVVTDVTMGPMEPEYCKAVLEYYSDVSKMTVKRMLLEEPPKAVLDGLKGTMERIEYVVGNLSNLPFSDASFDFVRSSGTVHEYEDEKNVAEARRVLIPNRKVVRFGDGIRTTVSVPDR